MRNLPRGERAFIVAAQKVRTEAMQKPTGTNPGQKGGSSVAGLRKVTGKKS